MFRAPLTFLFCSFSAVCLAQTPIEEKTKGMERAEGLFTTYRDAKACLLKLNVPIPARTLR
ncbi:MAG: hypothetical protein WD273_00390 [Trueperaceae bacterium]